MCKVMECLTLKKHIVIYTTQCISANCVNAKSLVPCFLYIACVEEYRTFEIYMSCVNCVYMISFYVGVSKEVLRSIYSEVIMKVAQS